jgi:dUTPase
MIPFKVKLLTETAKAPTQENEGDLWDLYADDFCDQNLLDTNYLKDEKCSFYNSYHQNILFDDDHLNSIGNNSNYSEEKVNAIQEDKNNIELFSQGRILVKTGITIELPIKKDLAISNEWLFTSDKDNVLSYAVADIRPRSGLALKHGITVLNTPGTIDNSYRKEIGVILYNAGHEPYTINKGDKIAQMLIRPLYPSKMEIVENIEDTQRGGFGSTGK